MPAIRKLATRHERQSRHGKRPSTVRDTCASQILSRTKNNTPAPSQHHAPSAQFEHVPLPRGFVQTLEKAGASNARFLSTSKRDADVGSSDNDMTLAQINNFTMRSEVAKLMAVAPGLPVRDLYHLIIDSKGQFEHARAQAIRMSEAPVEDFHSVRRTPSQPVEPDVDGDEITVKIDPFDPAYEFDSDSPPPEETLPKPKKRPKQKPTSKQKHSSKQIKPIYISSSSCGSNSGANPVQHPKPRPTIEVTRASKHSSIVQMQGTKLESKSKMRSRSRSTIQVYRGPTINPTHARETSSDRDFIVPDNAVVYISDDDDDDDDDDGDDDDGDDDDDGLVTVIRHEHSDVDMLDGDGSDLDIDMQPKYAFNRKVLWKVRGTRQ
jgi:hypothetical protein